MKVLLFDTETTGLPLKRQGYSKGPNNWPHIVSICWVILDSDTNEVLKEKYYVIYPERWTVPEQAAAIHGITTEKAIEEGYDLSVVMSEFLEEDYDIMVAHNLEFDYNVIGNAVQWDLGKEFQKIEKPKYCTMELSKFVCKIPYKSGGGCKPPKLSELYEYVFKREPVGALHNALYDTMLLVEIVKSCDFLRSKMNLPVKSEYNTTKNEGKKDNSRCLSIRLG